MVLHSIEIKNYIPIGESPDYPPGQQIFLHPRTETNLSCPIHLDAEIKSQSLKKNTPPLHAQCQ